MNIKIIGCGLLLILVGSVFPASSEPLDVSNSSELASDAISPERDRTISGAPRKLIAQGVFDRPDFFERGHDQFEQEVRQMERQSASPVLTIQDERGDPPSWHRFIFRNGGFTIWMPLGTITEETKFLETSSGNLEFNLFATHPPSSRFIAAYSERLNAERLESPLTLLAAVRDRVLSEQTGFELKSDRPIILDNNIGKEFGLQNADETITFRVYLIENRLYVLGASQQNIGELSPQVVTFFDSFKLL